MDERRRQERSAAAAAMVADKMAELRPHLRGWVHLAFLPPLVVAVVALVVLSPTPATRVGSAVYAASALLLFGVSAIYHRGSWEPEAWAFWRRFDHANIYILIAGTYTPFAVLYLDGRSRLWLAVTVWVLAGVGVIFTLGDVGPRWLSAPLYIALGWVVIFFIPQILDGADRFTTTENTLAISLLAAGGVIYTLGGVVYGLKRPNPSPEVFGFHEIFHVCTVLAFVAQYSAVSILTYST